MRSSTMILARWWQSAGRGWASRLRAEPRRRCGARPRWRRGADRGCAQWSGDGGGQPWRELARTRWWRGSVGCPALTGSGKKEGGEAARGTGSLAERPRGTGASVRAVARHLSEAGSGLIKLQAKEKDAALINHGSGSLRRNSDRCRGAVHLHGSDNVQAQKLMQNN